MPILATHEVVVATTIQIKKQLVDHPYSCSIGFQFCGKKSWSTFFLKNSDREKSCCSTKNCSFCGKKSTPLFLTDEIFFCRFKTTPTLHLQSNTFFQQTYIRSVMCLKKEIGQLHVSKYMTSFWLRPENKITPWFSRENRKSQVFADFSYTWSCSCNYNSDQKTIGWPPL